MISTDVLIIGAGPAGLTAGIYSARAGAKTVILEVLSSGGQINLTPDIRNFPGFSEIGGAELGEKMTAQAKAAGCEIVFDEVMSVDFDNNAVVAFENVYQFKSLIIATGCRPRGLGVEREDEFVGNGIHFCGLCDGAFYKGKDVIVVGGGNHAVEEAIYLTPIVKSVTMVTDTETLTAQEALISELDKKIKVYYQSGIAKILGEGAVTGAELKDGTKISVDGIFVAIGRVPNTELFAEQVKTEKGFIAVDKDMQTSLPNVFAAGDCIAKNVRQVITACADGAIAGSKVAAFKK